MKESNKNKAGVLVLSIVLCLSLFLAACGNAPKVTNNDGQNNSEQGMNEQESLFNPVGTYPIVKEKMTIKMFAPQLPNIENMETNAYTKYVEEKTNIKIAWDLANANALEERKQLMLASGDYPEVILHGDLTKEEQMKYGKQGVFIPLNDLIEEYAPNIKKMMDEISYLKQSITAPDGNIYALPQVNECYHCDNALKLWINKAWIDKLGLDMPTTTEEFYQVMKAFKERDPNENGLQDEIPLTGSDEIWVGNVTAFLMNSFIVDDYTAKTAGTFLSYKDGKVDFVANKEEWKQGLLYLNQLFAEGLIDPAAFTQNGDAIQQMANREPDNIMGGLTSALLSYAYDMTDAQPRHKDYVLLPPLKGPDGVQQTINFSGISTSQFAITNRATKEQQIAAIRLADYLFTEEAIVRQEKGVEGEGWRMAEPGELGLEGEQARYTLIPREGENQTRNDAWEQIGPSIRTYEYRTSWATPVQDELAIGGLEKRLHSGSKLYEPYHSKEQYPNSVFIAEEDAEIVAQLKTTILDYTKSNMAQFITGSKSIEKDWESYVKGFDGLQLDKYVEIYQKAVDVQ